MPLSQGQKEFIIGAIGHLIDFPNTREGLIACAKQITTCISSNNLSLAGEYQALCSCILNPSDMLRRLEDYNDAAGKATIGEVKNYVLALITKQLNDNCASLKMSLGDIEWQHEAIANTFTTQPEFASEFVSSRSRTEDQLQRWENIRFENSIFHAALYRNENSDIIRLEIRLTLPHETRFETIEDFTQIPSGENDEEALMHAIIPAASREAANRALDFLKTFLTKRHKFTDEQITKLTETQTIKPVILDGFYVVLLLLRPQLIGLFLTLTPPQVNILRHNYAKSILGNQLCTFEDILQFSAGELQLITLYSSEIKNKLISIDKFKKLTDVQIKTLSIPAVSNAIKSQKLPIEKALQFPEHAHALFTSPLYTDLFAKTEIDWSVFVFVKPHHPAFLLKPEIASLIKDKALSLSYIVYFTREQCIVFSNCQIIMLLANNILRSGHLLRADNETTNLLMSNTQVFEALLFKSITIRDVLVNVELQRDKPVSLHNINDIFAKIFIKRLNLILSFQPLQFTKVEGDTSGMLPEGRDCVSALVMDYLSIALLRHVDNLAIHNRLLTEFVSIMQLKLVEFTLENAKTNQPAHQRTLLKALHDSYHPGHNAYQRSVGLLLTAQEILAQSEMPAPRGLTLFPSTAKANTDQIIKLCKLVTEFESLIRVEEELTLDCDQTKPAQYSGRVVHI